MKIEMGESLLYSWLIHEKECQLAQTNWKASKYWVLGHEEELKTLLKASQESKYKFFEKKKPVSLQQIINQAEIDVIGIRDEDSTVYAVDVAFHENGLNYVSREKTTVKIGEKGLRTAMCLYGYFGIKKAEIVFTSPKVGKAIEAEAREIEREMKAIFEKCSLDFEFRVILNDAFRQDILDPVLGKSKRIADTSELFLRSYQLTQMFGDKNSR